MQASFDVRQSLSSPCHRAVSNYPRAFTAYLTCNKSLALLFLLLDLDCSLFYFFFIYAHINNCLIDAMAYLFFWLIFYLFSFYLKITHILERFYKILEIYWSVRIKYVTTCNCWFRNLKSVLKFTEYTWLNLCSVENQLRLLFLLSISLDFRAMIFDQGFFRLSCMIFNPLKSWGE